MSEGMCSELGCPSRTM